MTDDEADIYANLGSYCLRTYRIAVEETKEKLTSALARVAELEGLVRTATFFPCEGDAQVTVSIPRDLVQLGATTLGEAMPRKEEL